MKRRSGFAPPPVSDVDLFSNFERIIDLDTEVAHGALDFGVAEKQLDGA